MKHRSKIYGRSPGKRIYLISPKTPDSFWSMRGTVEAVGVRTLMPSNTLATLMALTPADVDVEYFWCDENVDAIDWSLDCDLVALTGFTLHAERLARIAAGFRRKGVPVALGGPFASLDTADAEKLADHLFIGEGEHTWPAFLRDLAAGKPKPRYVQREKVDLAHSPPPDWSLIDGRDYLYMTVQASRGCPNKCDFCDAIQLIGRRYRTKSIDQIMVEIANAQAAGAETIFFSEDNFYVKKSFTRELLTRIIEWNTRLAHPVQFSCQTSVRITDDEEILKLLADARFAAAFLGVESVRAQCLQEVNKGHLHRDDLADRIKALSSYGVLPFIGLIVGFDHDDEATFDEIERFLDETASPIASLSVLNAPEGTPLHARMSAAGRIDERFAGVWHFSTNIVPERWPLAELLRRHRDLFRRLYDPATFEPRAMRWLANVKYLSPLYANKRRHWRNLFKLAHILRHYSLRVPGPVRRQFFRILYETARRDPRLIRKAITVLTQYCHYYGFVNRSSWAIPEEAAPSAPAKARAAG